MAIHCSEIFAIHNINFGPMEIDSVGWVELSLCKDSAAINKVIYKPLGHFSSCPLYFVSLFPTVMVNPFQTSYNPF